ncbi:MAG TPA: hypothetical protein VG308_19000 [Stellaceae bacterium]|jgi:hypothetical protein|nr:hypothetical protein [Stellaceae bacterium]
MSDQRGDLVLEMLRAIRGDLAEVKADLVELKQRVGLLEAQYASLSSRVDRIGGDVVQIKRRLDLVEV